MLKITLGPFFDFSRTPDLTRLFKNWASSLFILYDCLSSCKESEKTVESIFRSCVADTRSDKQPNS